MLPKTLIFFLCIGSLISGCTSIKIETEYKQSTGLPVYSSNNQKQTMDESFNGSQANLSDFSEESSSMHVEIPSTLLRR